MSEGKVVPSDTVVRCSRLVQPADGDVRNPRVLSGGSLLRWMDSTACLAAEKLSKCPSVTANMDDLEFFQPVEVGSIVLIESHVTRVFKTSMEVSCKVEVEDMETGDKKTICSTSYFTFVSFDSQGEKVKLTPVTPVTPDEIEDYETAEKRRQVRLNKKQSIKDTANILHSGSIKNKGQAEVLKDEITLPSGATCVESTELVFINQTNHHSTLFGGQILEWMCNAAIIASSRLRSGFCTLRSIDDVYFVAPAKAGDRVFVRAQVNNTFSSSLEVGVRIEAYPIDGSELRHINSGFLTLVAVDKNGTNSKKNLPRLTFASELELQRSLEATARRKIRLDRRASRLRQDTLSVPWNDSKASELHLQNISALTVLRGRTGWHKIAEEEGVRLSMVEDSLGGTIIRIDGTVQTSPTRLFKLVSNIDLRLQWDKITAKMKVLRRVDENSSIVHWVMKPFRKPNPAVPGPNCFDLAVLTSVRMPTALSNAFVIAFRSISTPEIPAEAEYIRAEIGPTGFIITPVEGNSEESQVMYINTIGNRVLQYVSSDLVGSSHVHLRMFLRVREVSESLKRQTRLPPPPEETLEPHNRPSDENVLGCKTS